MDDKDIRDPESSTGEDGNSDIEEFENELGDEGDQKKSGKKSAEGRINELVAELKTVKEELEAVKAKETTPPPPPAPDKSKVAPEQQKAVEYIKGLDFVQKSDVEEKIKAIEDRLALDNEHSRLASSYDGADGRPKYDRTKVEAYMRDHAVYDPEIAYKALNETELLDWHMKKSNPDDNKKPYVTKPGSGSSTRGDNSITREKLAEVSANPTPENRAWYERNRNKILQLMAEGNL